MKGKVATMSVWAVLQVVHADVWSNGTVEPDTLVFGPVRTGSAMVDTVRIQNIGAMDLLVESASLPEPVYTLPGSPFSGAPILLEPNEALDLLVRFAPPDTGRFSGRLDVGTGSGPMKVDLEGEGVLEVIVINEILADPPSGEAGDANGDGVRNSNQDEFVELLNTGLRAVDMSGWQLSDRGASPSKRFSFPSGTRIGPEERTILFGGGSPDGIEGQVFTDDGRIGGGLSNSGDAVFLINPAGPDTLARTEYGSEGGKNQSLVRYPEGRGGFVRHSLFPGKGAAFSPGDARVVLSRIEIAPSDTSIALGETVSFTVTGIFTDADVWTLEDEVSWEVSDATILHLDGGLGEAVGLGEAGVAALAGGLRSPQARVEVIAPGIVGLAISPAETLVLVGDSIAYVVDGVYPDSSRVRIDGGLVWATSDSSVARPLEGNRVLAVGAGTVTVWAGLDDMLGTTALKAAETGDLNADGAHDLLDALHMVQLILNALGSIFERHAGDLNGDGGVDILDLAGLIGRILGTPIGSTKAAPTRIATWRIEDGMTLSVDSPVALRAVLLEVGGPVRLTQIEAGAEAVLTTQQSPQGTFRALIYSLSSQGVQGRDGALRIVLSPLEEEKAEDDVGVVSIQGVDVRGARVAFRQAPELPEAYALSQNLPNPFNSATVLSYSLPEGGPVALRIFSCLGQEVAQLAGGSLPAGVHRASWDGRDHSGRPVASGVYFARLEAGAYRAVVKMVLLR